MDHALPPTDYWAGREIALDDYVHDQEAGRRKKADSPSHLAEIAHAYNAYPHLLGTVHTI